ncbi:MAG: glycosyltransferase [Planctomycetia bacterium]|nr:glycosyltransferase [Planctomycetia bacterium]
MSIVSVIIPAYNSGRYLDEAVQSVIAQTFTDWECIVVDDGSTEDLSRVEKLDPRVRLIRQENRGTAAARNNAILHSVGELIAFLDHDDRWMPGRLERMVGVIRADPLVGAAVTGFDFLAKDGGLLAPGWNPPEIPNYAAAVRRIGGILGVTVMLRRTCIPAAGVFDPQLAGVEDIDFVLRIARVFRVSAIPERSYLYRHHDGNASRNYLWIARQNAEMFRRHGKQAAYTRDTDAAAAARWAATDFVRTFGTQAYDAARQDLREGNPLAFILDLSRALAWNPKYTLTSILKFPLIRLRRGGHSGSAELRWRVPRGR